MDETIRMLERQAAAGDEQAQERLDRLRARVHRPSSRFLANFYLTRPIPADQEICWLGESPDPNWRNMGLVLPCDALINSVTYQLSNYPGYQYRIEIWDIQKKEVLATARIHNEITTFTLHVLKKAVEVDETNHIGVAIRRVSEYVTGPSLFAQAKITLEFLTYH